MSEHSPTCHRPPAAGLDIRYIDDDLLVIDKPAGLLSVPGRGPEMHCALNRLFATRRVEKRYVALVAGRIAAGERVIDLPLIADWPNRPRQRVGRAIGKPSRTRLRVAGYEPALDATRVDLFPETGRSHQLRVHLQAIGHPILGDELYAPPEVFARAPRLLLHAAVLAFRHLSIAMESPAPF